VIFVLKVENWSWEKTRRVSRLSMMKGSSKRAVVINEKIRQSRFSFPLPDRASKDPAERRRHFISSPFNNKPSFIILSSSLLLSLLLCSTFFSLCILQVHHVYSPCRPVCNARIIRQRPDTSPFRYHGLRGHLDPLLLSPGCRLGFHLVPVPSSLPRGAEARLQSFENRAVVICRP
jgi:hypothetical protein